MECAVWTTSSDSEDATTEADEAPFNTGQKGTLKKAAAKASTYDASIGLAIVNKAASTRNGWESIDAVKAKAGEKPLHKYTQDLTHFGKKDVNKVPVRRWIHYTPTVNISKESESEDVFVSTTSEDEEQELVTDEDLGETAEEPQFHISTSDTITDTITSPRTVWILGDCLINGLQMYATKHGISETLGCPGVQVKWYGIEGMQWSGVKTKLCELYEEKHPYTLIIHCGGNNLGMQTGVSLIRLMKEDLQEIVKMFPHTQIVYSQICERHVWLFGAVKGGKLESARRQVNKVVTYYLLNQHIETIRHRNIVFYLSTLYSDDGVNLSTEGNQIFLKDFQTFLLK